MKLLTAITAAFAGLALACAPAEAIAYGGWTAHLTADGWHDDNLARGLPLTSVSLPNGNQDFGVHLGLTVGNVFVLTPDVDTWLLADAHGLVGAVYPSLDDTWGALTSNTVWRVTPDLHAYGLASASLFWGDGAYYAAELGLVRGLWSGANARVELGAGTYVTTVSGAGFTMPSAGLGLDQAFPTGTVVGLRYAFQALFYSTSPTPRNQVLVRVGQPLGHGFEVHASYLETIDTSANGYWDGYLGAGVSYDL